MNPFFYFFYFLPLFVCCQIPSFVLEEGDSSLGKIFAIGNEWPYLPDSTKISGFYLPLNLTKFGEDPLIVFLIDTNNNKILEAATYFNSKKTGFYISFYEGGEINEVQIGTCENVIRFNRFIIQEVAGRNCSSNQDYFVGFPNSITELIIKLNISDKPNEFIFDVRGRYSYFINKDGSRGKLYEMWLNH